MFAVYFEGILIGHSAFETGDPPMSVAEGRFIPTAAYSAFRERLLDEDGVRRLIGDIEVYLSDGSKLPTTSAYLLEADLGETGTEHLIYAVGVSNYATYFPGYLERYEASFKDT